MTNNNPLQDLLNDPLFQPSEKEQQLFQLTDTMTKVTKERLQADFIAQRRPCDNFQDYEPLFKQVHRELKEGKRHLAKFTYASLQEGAFLIIGGVLVYIAKILDCRKPNTSHFAFDGRTLTIYENGTESNVMIQTLGKAAYADGYTVTEPDEKAEKDLQHNMQLQPQDKQDGFIYVLSSLSQNPEIASIKNLYKIGYTTTSVEERIKNAQNETTYLCDKVKIEAVWRTYNLKTEVLETLIHQFFAAVRFQLALKDTKGNTYDAKEWYVAPLPIIQQVINYIIDGSIVHYCYNPQLQVIEETKERLKAGQFNTTGWNILTLNIKKVYFNQIIKGEKCIEYRELKESTLNRYTWVDTTDGKRYLRKYDALRLKVMDKSRQYMIVEVIDTTYDSEAKLVLYHLGKILTVDIEK